jgi:penicillin-binding protein 2
MHNEQEYIDQLHRRRFSLAAIACGACALFTVLFVRLGDIQLVQGKSFQAQADDNRFFHKLLPAQRGLILDRYGDPLVWNAQQYFQVSDPSVLFPVTTPIIREQALQLIASNGAEAVTTRPQRLYRFPNSLSHVVGYVGEVTAEDLQNRPQLKPGMMIGKAGLELQYQELLQGKEGEVVYEVNALGKKQRQVQVHDPVPGRNVSTTIDPYISEFLARQLGDSLGTALLTDVQTGKVIAMTSRPAFDPNIFSQMNQDPQKEVERRQRMSQLFSDPRNLFFNRAISGAYPPGSVFKIMTAFAGLENKKIDSSTEVIDEGVLKVGEYEYGNWYFSQYGRVEGAVNLSRALARSNDIYFYKVAEWVGPDALAEFARMFGFGSKTGIELPAEARGMVPDTSWKEKVRGEKWYLGNTYHYGIGQGDVLTTPIQVAQMSQAVANGGVLCPLSVLSGSTENGNVRYGNRAECHQVGITSEHWETVMKGMIEACSQGGTAFPLFSFNTERVDPSKSAEFNFANGAVACKTGTAEFGGANEKGHRRTHGWITVLATLPNMKNGQPSTASAAIAASESARVVLEAPSVTMKTVSEMSDDQLHQAWEQKARSFGFPTKVSLTVLVESDDSVPFREGSKDAGPIARSLLDWMTR